MPEDGVHFQLSCALCVRASITWCEGAGQLLAKTVRTKALWRSGDVAKDFCLDLADPLPLLNSVFIWMSGPAIGAQAVGNALVLKMQGRQQCWLWFARYMNLFIIPSEGLGTSTDCINSAPAKRTSEYVAFTVPLATAADWREWACDEVKVREVRVRLCVQGGNVLCLGLFCSGYILCILCTCAEKQVLQFLDLYWWLMQVCKVWRILGFFLRFANAPLGICI